MILPIPEYKFNLVQNMKPSYLAFLSPNTFLTLTCGKHTTKEEIDKQTKTNLESYNPENYTVPWLRITFSGRVIGHNGRHRAIMVKRANHKYFPFMIIFMKYSFEKKKYIPTNCDINPKLLKNQFTPKYKCDFPVRRYKWTSDIGEIYKNDI